MANDEFKLCDKYGLVRNYKMETDFMITAWQVEKCIEALEFRINALEEILKKGLPTVWLTREELAKKFPLDI